MSLSTLFSTARRSLLAHSAATAATSTNIANVETPGYTKRSARLASDPSARGGLLITGRAASGGVAVAEYGRTRLALLDDAARRGRTAGDGAGESARLLAGLEGALAPDGGDAFLGAVSSFFDAWGDVANAPTDGGARDALLAATDTLARALGGAAERADATGRAVQTRLGDSVDRVNGLLAEVASLNEAVRTSRAQGADDLDALDRRDLALDELSGLGPFAVRNEADGTATVTVAGMIGVQGGESNALRVAAPPEVPVAAVFAEGASSPLRLGPEDGAIGAQLGLLTTSVPNARAALDTLAADLVARVNAAHVGGAGLDGGTGRTFFDPAGTTATSLALSADVTGPDAVAAAAGGAGQGDSTTATAIGGLSEDVGGAAVRLLSGLGAEVRKAGAAATANEAFADHAEALRDGVTRVSLDEEMTDLIRHQQAYAASARVLQTAESLFDTLLAI